MKNKQKAFISIFSIFFAAVIVSILTALYILLLKQIEIMNQDSMSFQALYIADSTFECMTYKLQTATGTENYFLPTKQGGIGYCVSEKFDNSENPDVTWVKVPSSTSGKRSTSELKVDYKTSNGDYFCGYVLTGVQTDNSEVSNSMNISGQSRKCSDTTSTRVIERIIDFYF